MKQHMREPSWKGIYKLCLFLVLSSAACFSLNTPQDLPLDKLAAAYVSDSLFKVISFQWYWSVGCSLGRWDYNLEKLSLVSMTCLSVKHTFQLCWFIVQHKKCWCSLSSLENNFLTGHTVKKIVRSVTEEQGRCVIASSRMGLCSDNNLA